VHGCETLPEAILRALKMRGRAIGSASLNHFPSGTLAEFCWRTVTSVLRPSLADDRVW